MFERDTVQLTDFTIRVTNLPHHEHYGDDGVLRAVITRHFEELVKEEVGL